MAGGQGRDLDAGRQRAQRGQAVRAGTVPGQQALHAVLRKGLGCLPHGLGPGLEQVQPAQHGVHARKPEAFRGGRQGVGQAAVAARIMSAGVTP